MSGNKETGYIPLLRGIAGMMRLQRRCRRFRDEKFCLRSASSVRSCGAWSEDCGSVPDSARRLVLAGFDRKMKTEAQEVVCPLRVAVKAAYRHSVSNSLIKNELPRFRTAKNVRRC